MPATVSLVTLGVSDLARAIAFYEAIGFTRVSYDSTAIAFFEAGGPQLALFPRNELAADAHVSASGNGFSGVTLSQNFSTSREVDELLSLAADSGGKLIKPAEPVNWGGYSGYFADPDGHLWEAACGSAEYQRELKSNSE
jgi:predicted lactoylglutathione lyase